MITAYTHEGHTIHEAAFSKNEKPPEHAIWIDLLSPDDEERAFISSVLGIDLPDQTNMQEIELSSRLYKKGHATYLTQNVLIGYDTPDPILDELLIVIAPKCLVTMRFTEPRSIEIFKSRIKKQAELFATTEDGLLALLDAISDRIADMLESMGRDLNVFSHQLFPRTPSATTHKKVDIEKCSERRMNVILQSIGHAGEMTQKIGSSINGMMRLLTFLAPYSASHFNNDQMASFHALEQDMKSLNDHVQLMAQEVSFFLDATLGQINIEQNNIIKIFSMVMVAFTPPTFFASMWGMNFHDMPEYVMPYGYPIALGIMAISAIIPMIYFYKKKWL